MTMQPSTWEEPILPMDDIQGIAVPGFFKPQQQLLGVTWVAKPAVTTAFKKLLAELVGDITTASQALADRRAHRRRRAQQQAAPAAQAGVLTAVGFTHQGLAKLTPGAQAVPSEAYRRGLPARSAFLGDPTDAGAEGAAKNWKVGATGQELDALFIVAGNTEAEVEQAASALVERLQQAGVDVTYREKGGLRHDLPGHEHFGFDDGVSQPGIRGRASEAHHDYITERTIAPSQHPEHALYGKPGQDLVWPGVLLLGHPATSPDPLIPGLPSPAVPDWTRNGSFLVFRRLRQDVGLFWRTMRDTAQALSAQPGFDGLTDEALAARIVGRWPSGAPVNRVPEQDLPALGQDDLANNNFRFDSPSVAYPLVHGHEDAYPMAQADPAGTRCPWAAHIRKVNTRDSGSDMGGRDATYARRLLRVGVPFGQPLKDRYADLTQDPDKGERGLLFLSIQASIEDQFEFLTTRWMGDPSRPKTPAGHDVFIGQNATPGEDRVRRCTLFGKGLEQTAIETSAQWVVPTGGGYFFIPSLSALRQVLSAQT
jgi:Dyp-type peroxidase family